MALNYSRIGPDLLVGAAPKQVADLDLLAGVERVSAVLNVQTDEDLAYHRIDWPALSSAMAARGLAVVRHPIRDFDYSALRDNLPAAVRELDGLFAAGHHVYVHCNVGINRSPTTVIAYLHRHRGLGLGAAADLVAARRPQVQPYLDAILEADWDAAGTDRG